MFTTERRKHFRVSFCKGAIVENQENDSGENIMNSIVIQDISLGGIGFIADIKQKYERHKVYNLKLKANLPWKNIDLSLKIVIIRNKKDENTDCYFYGAVYRNLSTEQSKKLKEIIEYQKGIDAVIDEPIEKTQNIKTITTKSASQSPSIFSSYRTHRI